MSNSVTLRVGLAAAMVVLGGISAGCSGDPASPVAADCTNQVRLDGRVYSSYGFTNLAATRFADVELADCHDLGRGAPGSVFPEDAHHVSGWSFPGYSTDDVLGVPFDEDSFAVYVSDAVPPAESERLFTELAGDAGSLTDRELALAQEGVRQETSDEALDDAILESASVTVGPGRVRMSNTGHPCNPGRLLRIRLIGTFPHILTTGNPGATADEMTVRAVLLTADAVSGQTCLIGVMTGHPTPRPGARVLSIY